MYKLTLEYVKTREQFGKRIGDFDAFGHVGMNVVFVHCGDVIKDVFTVFKHTLHARTDNRRKLVAVSGVV